MAIGSHDCRRCPRCRVNCCYSRGDIRNCLGDTVESAPYVVGVDMGSVGGDYSVKMILPDRVESNQDAEQS